MLKYLPNTFISKAIDKVIKLVMDKKTKIALEFIVKVYNRFPQTRQFTNKAINEACYREIISVDEVVLIINNNCWCFPVL